jgi:hypothetical protein
VEIILCPDIVGELLWGQPFYGIQVVFTIRAANDINLAV